MTTVVVTVERVPPDAPVGKSGFPRRPGWWYIVKHWPHESSGWAPTEIEAWQKAGSVVAGRVKVAFPPKAA